jgi:hypothetical protein
MRNLYVASSKTEMWVWGIGDQKMSEENDELEKVNPQTTDRHDAKQPFAMWHHALRFQKTQPK